MTPPKLLMKPLSLLDCCSCSQAKASLAGKCSTDVNGVCFLPLTSSLSQSSMSLTAVVSKGKDVAVVPVSSFFSAPSTPSYIGAVVVDSLLVIPGNAVHVSGYIQQQKADGTLSLPAPGNGPTVALQFGYGWNASNPNAPVVVPVTLNPTSGSFQAIVPVPTTTTMGTYSLEVMVSDYNPSPASESPVKFIGRGRHLSEAGNSGSHGNGRAMKQLVMPTMGKMGVSHGGFSSGPSFGGASSSSQPVSVSSLTLTVADPRQPTAALTLNLPPLVSNVPSVLRSPVLSPPHLSLSPILISQPSSLSPTHFEGQTWVCSKCLHHGRIISWHKCLFSKHHHHLDDFAGLGGTGECNIPPPSAHAHWSMIRG